MFGLIMGYLVMALLIFIFRFFYNILPKRNSSNGLIYAVKQEFTAFHAYAKKLVSSHNKIIRIIVAIMIILFIRSLINFENEITDIVECALGLTMFFLLVIVFAPQDELSHEGFPTEIFGFIYSVIFMFYSAGSLVFATFYTIDFLKEKMWIYGYGITIISYVICIATLRRFMERKLSKEEIVLLGMIIMTTLEFITYYGVGFFGGIQWYNPQAFEENIFGDITSIINQGIFMASQSQILERSSVEIWGYILLNGTDVLTITAVLGYVVQKFMDSK